MSLTPEHLAAATAAVRNQTTFRPAVVVILGTGMHELAARVEVQREIRYADIPGFLPCTAPGHAGRLLLGHWSGTPVVVLDGRCHLYEGHPPDRITLPVRVGQALGADRLVVTNASGGLNPRLRTGDVLLVEDHLNLTFANPLIGPPHAEFGPRFPDLCRPYDEALLNLAERTARRYDFAAPRGVYAAMTGPNYETRAEYRMLRLLGADVVGMSTVPEALIAAQLGMRTLALSIVTNLCRPDTPRETTAAEVLHDAEGAQPRVAALLEAVMTDVCAAGAID